MDKVLENILSVISNSHELKTWNIFHEQDGNVTVRLKFSHSTTGEIDTNVLGNTVSFRRKSSKQVTRDRNRAAKRRRQSSSPSYCSPETDRYQNDIDDISLDYVPEVIQGADYVDACSQTPEHLLIVPSFKITEPIMQELDLNPVSPVNLEVENPNLWAENRESNYDYDSSGGSVSQDQLDSREDSKSKEICEYSETKKESSAVSQYSSANVTCTLPPDLAQTWKQLLIEYDIKT